MRFGDLQRTTIVITGVTRGLGRAMVDEFVRLGHIVSGCGRTKSEIERLVQLYPEHDFQVVDVASHLQVRAWAEHLIEKHGAPRLVLNNAAVLNAKAPLWEVSDQDFSNEIEVNIKGVVNVIRHFAPSMIGRRRGVIINFCSRWAVDVEKLMGPYCATKWAVIALTRVLAQELQEHGVAVIGLNPGIVQTAMLKRYLSGNGAAEMSDYLTPNEWAAIAVPFILRLSLKDTGKLRHVLAPPTYSTCTRTRERSYL